MQRYNKINNLLGWLCFLIAAVTYLLTLEPTASFWDCPEFILQAMKFEVGHPPGNPVFMLAGRFFVNFAGGDVTKVALMVNAMSGLLSAGTILLLFWTITHLVKRLTVKDDATDVSLTQMLVIFGSGLCGALAYTWSDTFWFSAVEGEVYAFSSFCTALVFWLILKWENRADTPHSDKYLVLIAYVIGISIAVHLLNLLCIPAIVLVIYYRKWSNTTAKGSLIALCVSAVIVGLILYGLVPGFVEVAQYFELFFVNTVGLSFNMGVLIYALLLVGSFVWAIAELYRQRSISAIRWSVLISVLLSGMLFIGSSMWIPLLLTVALATYLWCSKKLSVRIINIAILSIFVIFIGYASYALLLIRSSANPPMNQNAPDNVFALASYLNREQYGERPLFYGQTFQSGVVYQLDSSGSYAPKYADGDAEYAKEVKTAPGQKDRYIMTGHKRDYSYTPELNMLFPRIYSGAHAKAYSDWLGGEVGYPVDATLLIDANGEPVQKAPKRKPSFAENLNFFMIYQLNHMYWRYFMWNFAGRQNDIQGNGEVNHGNWISGIPFIDNPRLGDQSLLPYDEGEGNKGHNVFYMLPLLLGIIGLIWQAFVSKRGIEQFWVVFFLFFMTGIAIVIYLNQTPTQPRERDYAFAGSFYAFAIWLGMGVAGLTQIIRGFLAGKKVTDAAKIKRAGLTAAIVAAVVGVLVPLQMVSQTWDDHDRSGRYVARDFGMNYLNSLDENAIIFTNGDNDTFPLWYAQEVEGVRTDVKVVNLSYLTTDWYADMMRYPSYEAPGIDMLAKPADYAYNNLQFAYFNEEPDTTIVDARSMLRHVYSPASRKNGYGVPMIDNPFVAIPVDLDKAVASGRITSAEAEVAMPAIVTNLANAGDGQGLTLGHLLSLDMIATSMENGWNRPVYFAMTVPDDYYLGMSPFLRNTGMTYEVSPLYNGDTEASGYIAVDTDRAYRNITERFRWGGLDTAKPGSLYLDETVRRMVTTTRSTMLELAEALISEGNDAAAIEQSTDNAEAKQKAKAFADERYKRARNVLELMQTKLPEATAPYAIQVPQHLAALYDALYTATGNKADRERARQILHKEILRYGRNLVYYRSLTPTQYSTLQRTDLYIDQSYVPTLLSLYHSMDGDLEGVVNELQTMGVDINRLVQG